MMKRIYLYIARSVFLFLFMWQFCFPTGQALAEATIETEKLSVNSQSAILIDSRSGDVLYEKNSDEEMAPASITKIVTGIIALEVNREDEQVTVSRNARQTDGTRIFLAEGEQKSLKELVYGLLMNSGNDAAVAIAEHIDGNVAEFSRRMNEFATSVGATHTHFTNPSGLYEKEHTTTAADMAKMAAHAMKNEKFREIVSTRMKTWEGKEWKSKLVNHNKMLVSYKGANGIKNGFTKQSGFTLVTSAERNGTEFIAVLLKASSDQQIYKDATRLLDYGFSHFKTVPVLKAGTKISGEMGDYYAKENVYAAIPKDDSFKVRVVPRNGLAVETSSGFTRQYPSVLNKEQRITADASNKQMVVPKMERSYSLPEFFMLFFWWLMISFMSWIMVLLLKKKRV
ncbi:D-alanyl-D-alanine carboxypeptidase family protein [Aneurinibacillus aneurinilyticus]|uniref:D-alanyl-D-alanine carboxypeptidase n=3 Tax=Aneurinibacillus aneurinilyticus TaxID=1391 RepID=A0A848CR42_ANEAE|nr:D-alanyl-D-alanine carboxypeptidase family protein [Aneurinibacillus aneurinilyticus]NME97648.1 D-alanyl-D-alanine carboxypeptidase [Aneurinibacillus aneurinilyticus]